MRNVLGVACLVGGAMLIVWGRNMAHSVGGVVHYVFTGSPGDKPMWLYVGGAVLGAIGLFQLLRNLK
jgi:hypothetical protein